MRIDKFLKVSRIVKRRSVANDMCSGGRVKINGKACKPGTEVKVGDIIEIGFGSGTSRVKVRKIAEHVGKADAATLYDVLNGDGGF